jgi:hypothetical protein
MAIESVTTTTYAPPQSRPDQAAQAATAEQSRPAREVRQAESTRQDNEATESRPPQPVVNAQGQMTGTTISTIA